MASASSSPRNDQDQPRQTVTRTARAARTGLLFTAAVILGWSAVGAYQFADTYGSWYEHTIFVGGIGALLTLTAVATAHRVAPWNRPARFASIVACLLAVAALTAAGTVMGARAHAPDTRPAASTLQDHQDGARSPLGCQLCSSA